MCILYNGYTIPWQLTYFQKSVRMNNKIKEGDYMAQSEAQRRAKTKYNSKTYEELKLRVFKGNKSVIQEYCKDKNTTVNSLINQLLYERLTADGYHLIVKDAKDGEE